MSDYWKRLKAHPGVPIATVLSFAGPVVGLMREDNNWWVGLIMLVFWIPVLITARTQPLPKEPPRWKKMISARERHAETGHQLQALRLLTLRVLACGFDSRPRHQ